MAGRTVKLDMTIDVDASSAVTGFDRVGAAANDMARDLDAAGAKTQRSVADMTDRVDRLGSTSSAAAGGIGDLGGALSLIPGPIGAIGSGMEVAGSAIMGVTGAADLASLAMNSNALATVRARAATVAHTVATGASRVATIAATLAQRGLNLAMRANPIGLIITLVAALVGGFILLYNRSATVRNIVNAVGQALLTAGRWIAGVAVQAAQLYLRFNPLAAIIRLVAANFGNITAAVQRFISAGIQVAMNNLNTARAVFASVGGFLRGTFAAAINAITAPFRAVSDAIQSVIGWLGRIRIPSALSSIGSLLSGLPGFSAPVTIGAPALVGGVGSLDRRSSITAALGPGPDLGAILTRVAGGGGVTYVDGRDLSVTVTVTGDQLGMIDEAAVARRLQQLLDRHRVRIGTAPTFGRTA